MPRALAQLWTMLKDSKVPPADALALLFDMDEVLGVGLAQAYRKVRTLDAQTIEWIKTQIQKRAEAKKGARFCDCR